MPTTGERILAMPHSYRVDSIDISADGELLLTATGNTGGGRRSQAWVWNLEAGKVQAETGRLLSSLSHARFTPDQRKVILGANPLGVFSAGNGALLFPAVPQGSVNFIALSPDGKRAATASEANGAAYVWDVQTGKELFTLPNTGAGCITSSSARTGCAC